MMTEKILLVACGLFFLTGLLTGIWKYISIRREPDFKAPHYVSLGHRAALMYSFACLVLLELTRQGSLPDTIEIAVVSLVIGFFAAALGTYLIHGLLNDTDNQLARPHRLGGFTWPAPLITIFMVMLITVEVGGFLILFIAALL